MRLKRIPFDSLTLAASILEAGEVLAGGKVQRVLTLDGSSVALGIYSKGAERWLLLSADAEFARLHLLRSRPKSPSQADEFAKLLRANLDGARVADIRQVGFDRITHLSFETPAGKAVLIAETMGKHSNLILVDAARRIVACMKSIGPSKSRRPITIGRTYAAPPFDPRKPLLESVDWEGASLAEGASPFLLSLLQATTKDWVAARKKVADRLSGGHGGFAAAGFGVYPLDPSVLGYGSVPIESIGAGLEAHFTDGVSRRELESAKQALLGQLDRVQLARGAAIHDLEQALDIARTAGEYQLKGELILAHLHEIREGQTRLVATDYEGNPVEVSLVADLSAKENAERLFAKAKKAKSHAPEIRDTLGRLKLELAEVRRTIDLARDAIGIAGVERLRGVAMERRWLHVQREIEKSTGRPVDPFEGHRIRTFSAPGGWSVLFGENATSNDYLTLRIAKPNDWWLHVRGATSAHVVIQTSNQPQRVGIEALRFAARLAVKNSASKHSKYVPVDYTLKKYVRKPRGAHPGTALYTHEKTLHVEAD